MDNLITKEDINLSYCDLILEITRWCNMKCPHCIRGEREKLRIKREFINATFEQFKEICRITVSGGEPALAVDIMDYILYSAKHHDLEVQNFWMATNGSITTKRFFNSIKNWFYFTSDGEMNGLRISMDNYHDDIGRNRYKFEDFYEELSYDLTGFYFEYQGAPDDTRNLISEGRSAENFYSERTIRHDLTLRYDGRIEGSLYINAKGFVISTCDISYETEDNDKEYIICHCTEDIREGLANFFNKHNDFVEHEFWECTKEIINV